MRWNWNWRELLDPGERARREHERWLNAALARGVKLPRIPCRRVDLGGFGALMSTPAGRAAAERWWSAALSAVPERFDGSGAGAA